MRDVRKMKWSMTALLICLLHSSILAGNPDDWSMYQHDPQHSGYSSSRMPGSLEEVWTNESYCKFHIEEVRIQTNKNYSRFDLGSHRVRYLAVSEDSVFVTDLCCFSVLDVNSGFVIWSIQMPMISANFPAIKNNRLFFSDLSLIRCFDVDTGEELWKLALRAGIGCTVYNSSPPIAVDELVIWEGGGGRIMCLDSETGGIVWEFYHDNFASFSPAYFNGRVYTNDGAKHVYCLDVQTGDLIWKREIEWNSSSHLSLDGERIFAGTSRGVMCLKSETGEILWRFECEKIPETPAVAYNKVFAGDRAGILYCLDAENGGLLWKMETGSNISSPIIVADKKVAFGTDDGTLYIVGAGSGKICESLDFDNGITGLALSDGKLFVGLDNGRVSCFEESVHMNLFSLVFILALAILLVFMSVWYRWKAP